jgi:hypothetical protein
MDRVDEEVLRRKLMFEKNDLKVWTKLRSEDVVWTEILSISRHLARVKATRGVQLA